MKETRLKDKVVALFLAGVLHLLLIILLLFLYLPLKEIPNEDLDGIMVSIGNIETSSGVFQPSTSIPLPSSSPDPITPVKTKEPLLTEDNSESMLASPFEEEKVNKEKLQQQQELEQKRIREERRKLEQEQIRQNIFGAFGQQNNQTTDDSSGNQYEKGGVEGSPEGNTTNTGATTGIGGLGSYALDGRRLLGGLPRPSFNKQIEGTIVIQIIVTPLGKVISANIAPGTTITDYDMRQSALKAATQSQFSESKESTNQAGTITYKYRLL